MFLSSETMNDLVLKCKTAEFLFDNFGHRFCKGKTFNYCWLLHKAPMLYWAKDLPDPIKYGYIKEHDTAYYPALTLNELLLLLPPVVTLREPKPQTMEVYYNRNAVNDLIEYRAIPLQLNISVSQPLNSFGDILSFNIGYVCKVVTDPRRAAFCEEVVRDLSYKGKSLVEIAAQLLMKLYLQGLC